MKVGSANLEGFKVDVSILREEFNYFLSHTSNKSLALDALCGMYEGILSQPFIRTQFFSCGWLV